jgi:hypothetical protein
MICRPFTLRLAAARAADQPGAPARPHAGVLARAVGAPYIRSRTLRSSSLQRLSHSSIVGPQGRPRFRQARRVDPAGFTLA